MEKTISVKEMFNFIKWMNESPAMASGEWVESNLTRLWEMYLQEKIPI